MSELKPCANCVGEATMQAPNMHRMTCIACKECGMSTGWGTVEEVTATWNRRAQPANEPNSIEIDAIKNEPPTNADLIRAMDDEELARALKGAEIQALLLGTTSTEGVWLDWLRQPAEEVRDGQTI